MRTLKVAIAPSCVPSAKKIINIFLKHDVSLISDFVEVPRKERCQILGAENSDDTDWVYLYDWQSPVSLATLCGSKEDILLCKSRLSVLRAALTKTFALNANWQKVTKPAGETVTSIIPCGYPVPLRLLTKVIEKTKSGEWRYSPNKSVPPFNRSFSQWLLKNTGIKTPMRFEHSGKEDGEYYIYILSSIDTTAMSPYNTPIWKEIEKKIYFMESL